MPGPDLALLSEAAEAAGEIALGYFRNDPKVWEKPGEGPVTEADLAVDAMLKDRLRAARPDYGWLSEESADDADRLDREAVFVVDPIDGTRAFAAGKRTFAHALAVVRGGVATAAVVFLPARGKLYAAEAGGGATLNGVALSVAAGGEIAGGTVLANRRNFEAGNWPGGVPDVARDFRPSLAYRLCLVGEGRFDAALTLTPAWEWDIAAGALVAAEAGATVSDGLGRPLSYNSPGRKVPGCIAARAGAHADLIRLRAA